MDDDILRIRAHEALVNELMTDDNYGNDVDFHISI